jgi:hypothetical protein
LTLALAGPDFAFVGKSASMDGSKFRPAWFTPHIVSCVRPDGQAEDVMIAGVGMDAAWHLPSMTQVKVIVNSTDGELADGGKGGPAQLTPYVIDRVKDGQVQYRWHNPPIAQNGAVVVPPMPITPPAPPAPPSKVLPKGEAFKLLKELDAFYRSADGLNRPDGLGPDMEGIAQWFYQLAIEGVGIDNVKAQIRNSDEWKAKHQ